MEYENKLLFVCRLRLETKQKDKRLNFMFASEDDLLSYDYMSVLCSKLMLPSVAGKKGVKIIDFSEVPSDILPLIVSLIARIIFSVQQWTTVEHRHPIAIFCDEAHLYIPANTEKSIDDASLVTFERISKEGRKYGIGLVVISQRPSEVNRTVLSQSNNFIAMRLTNVDDQSVVKRLLPDSLGDYAEMLPILDIGEALVVGDASLLPSRIRITPPTLKPRSATIDFWDEWSKDTTSVDISGAIEDVANREKLGIVRRYGGHGVGHSMHEDPFLFNYRVGDKTLIKSGMVIAIEPMLNLGGDDVEVLADDWTVVTKDGMPSAHFEHTVLATDGDPILMTTLIQ